MAESSLLETHLAEGIFRLNLNRPEKRNAMSADMWRSLLTELQKLEESTSYQLLVLRGQPGCCSAGADIGELREHSLDQEWMLTNNELIKEAQLALERLPIATLAVVDGYCMGGGCGLMLACDYRLASACSVFAITPAKLGLLYSLEDTRRLVNVVGLSRAKQMLFLAEVVKAEQAASWGLVNEVCPQAQIEARSQKLIETLCSMSPFSLSGLKKTFTALAGLQDHDIGELQRLFEQAFATDEYTKRTKAFMKK